MNAKPLPSPNRGTRFWRWVFLCALTIQATIFLILVCESVYHRRLDFEDYPLRTSFLGIVYISVTLFLFLTSPVFIRRLGTLAVVALFTPIMEIFCDFLIHGWMLLDQH